MTEPIFIPTNEMMESSNLYHYMLWLNHNKGFRLKNYEDIWQWSVDHLDDFWISIIQYFNVRIDTSQMAVRSKEEMPGVKWFESTNMNYAEYLIRNATPDKPALIACDETGRIDQVPWQAIETIAANLQAYLRTSGLHKGDRIVAYLPNIKESSASFLASIASGYIWSVCSPDFGDASVIDRFKQIEPKVIIAVDGYQYGGKYFDRREALKSIIKSIPSLQLLILVRSDQVDVYDGMGINVVQWQTVTGQDTTRTLQFEILPFNHPLWIVYSSGTTGLPKAITHSHGGTLLEHLKYVHFHNNVKNGERFFWFSTTGWMMWNYLHATWLAGATIILYDGNPVYPHLDTLWKLADQIEIDHFGAGAPFLHACMKERIQLPPLRKLKSISSTGSPLSAETFPWLFQSIPHPFYLWSMSGGTDIASAFVGGCPMRPVYIGEIQCRALGCDLDVLDETGHSLMHAEGELVIKQPMPCMPIYFWNDLDGKKYHESYFEQFPGIWRHGDWITLTAHDGLIISGRSDTTLKRFGVRIGTAEIYAALIGLPELEDALIIHIENKTGDSFMPLFVKLKPGFNLDESLLNKIKNQIKTHCSPRHVPDRIVQINDIPYTLSGKKMEAAVKKLFMGKKLEEITSIGAMRNPECLNEYEALGLKMKF